MKRKLFTLLRGFRQSELGQDLAEYCLITALIALCACGIFYKVSGGMQNLWTTANTTLASSPQPATGPATGDTPLPPRDVAPATAPAR